MEYKLIAIDMDGTMLNSNHEVSRKNVEVVKKAIDKGVNVVISTGRSSVALKKYVEEFDFKTPFIVYNGAGLKYLDTKEYLSRTDLDFEIAKKVCERGVELGTTVLAWADDELYVKGAKEVAKFYSFHSGTEFIEIEDFDALKCKGIHKVMFSDNPENIRKLYDIFVEDGYNLSNFNVSIPKILEFYDKSASKGDTVLKYADSLGIKQEEIICIGDGMNDISMVEMAGLGVAMGNACEELKAVADFVSKTNDEDGVAFAIEKFVLNK